MWGFYGRTSASVLLLAVWLGGMAQAATPEIDASRLLPPPPMAGSDAAKAEIAELHAIAASSSADLLEKARRDDGGEKPDMFNAALGFDVTALPLTAKLLSEVTKQEALASKAAKSYFHRDRPWIVDASIKTCVPVKPGPAATSYPSGHTSLVLPWAWCWHRWCRKNRKPSWRGHRNSGSIVLSAACIFAAISSRDRSSAPHWR